MVLSQNDINKTESDDNWKKVFKLFKLDDKHRIVLNILEDGVLQSLKQNMETKVLNLNSNFIQRELVDNHEKRLVDFGCIIKDLNLKNYDSNLKYGNLSKNNSKQ